MKLTAQRKHLWLSNKINLLLTSRVSPFPTAHGQEQSSQDLVYPPFRSLVRHLPCARTAPWTGSLVVQAEARSNTRLKCSSIVQTPQKHGCWSPAVRETDAQSPGWMESSGTMLRISLLSSFWLVRIARGNEWHPWTPRLYFVDGFLEHLANADSESIQMRKADSTVSAAEGLPWSRTPLWAPFPHFSVMVHRVHSSLYACDSRCLWERRKINCASFLPTASCFPLSQRHCCVMCREIRVMLITVINAHQNTTHSLHTLNISTVLGDSFFSQETRFIKSLIWDPNSGPTVKSACCPSRGAEFGSHTRQLISICNSNSRVFDAVSQLCRHPHSSHIPTHKMYAYIQIRHS